MPAGDPLAAIAALRQHRQGARRAPHKPLVLLWALARLLRGEERLARWSEARRPLEGLLRDFGRPGSAPHPEYPFWRLLGDGLWEMEHRDALQASADASGNVLISQLTELDPGAGFDAATWTYFREHPELARAAAQRLLDDNFPPSLHEDVLTAVGMPAPGSGVAEDAAGDAVEEGPRRRDPRFRAKILRIYEHRCAVCGYRGRLGPRDLGLEAAHVRWHNHDGPDTEDNGVAMCAFHHRVFDSGAMALSEDRTLLVSQEVHGADRVAELILDYAGAPLLGPLAGAAPVSPDFAAWHRQEVFLAPARVGAQP